MTLAEIKKAIEEEKNVYWTSLAYQVIRDNTGQYLIKCISNGSCIGLTWTDDITMNGKEEDFFVIFDTI